MKRSLYVSVLVALLCAVPPAFARPVRSVERDADTTRPVLTTPDGVLDVNTEVLNSDRPQIYITQTGKLISPMPTRPDQLARWQATQVWIDENIQELDRVLEGWRIDHGIMSQRVPLATYMNDRLQDYLGRVGAAEEIGAIRALMSGTRTPYSTVTGGSTLDRKLAGPGPAPMATGCGPHGHQEAWVNCCTQVCTEFGCDPIECHLCDCRPGSIGCCVYFSD